MTTFNSNVFSRFLGNGPNSRLLKVSTEQSRSKQTDNNSFLLDVGKSKKNDFLNIANDQNKDEQIRAFAQSVVDNFASLDINGDKKIGILEYLTASSTSKEADSSGKFTASDFIAANQKFNLLQSIPYTNVQLASSDTELVLKLPGDSKNRLPLRLPITKRILEDQISLIQPGTPESKFYPFLKQLQKKFDRVDSNGDGLVDKADLQNLAQTTGGGNTITLGDFNALSRVNHRQLKADAIPYTNVQVINNGTLKLSGSDETLKLFPNFQPFVTRAGIEDIMNTLDLDSPEGKFYPVLKLLLENFAKIDLTNPGGAAIGQEDLLRLAGLGGGEGNKTITAGDFKKL